MWSAVVDLHFEALHFLTTFQSWPSTQTEELADFEKLLHRSRDFWMFDVNPEESGDPASWVPEGLYDAMARVYATFKESSRGRSSPFVLMVPTMEALERVFVEVFEGYEGPLGVRTNVQYKRLWREYMKRATEVCVNAWTAQAAEIKAYKAESDDLIALEQAPHKWAFYEMLQRRSVLPLLPVPTASVVRRLAAQVTGMEWGVYSVSAHAL